MLKPSSPFVESLHEWLFFGPLSSAFDHDFYPLHTGIYSTQLQKIVWCYHIPPHFVSDPRKQKYSPAFKVFFRMRGILTKNMLFLILFRFLKTFLLSSMNCYSSKSSSFYTNNSILTVFLSIYQFYISSYHHRSLLFRHRLCFYLHHYCQYIAVIIVN